jgi:tetratricopeptide (TPR) repeat protein
VSFSPDGKTIATASDDNTVKLWNLQGQELKTLKGHGSPVYDVSFSPDGKTIATASADNSVKLWNLQGQELKTLKGHSSYVTSVSFSPDGKTIATASFDNTAILWNFDFENLQAEGCNWLKDYLVIHPRDLETLEVCQNPSILMAAAAFLVKEGEEQARQGNVKDAVATFRQALKWNPNLTLNPDAKAQQLADASDEASDLVKQGEESGEQGDIGKLLAAIDAVKKGLKLDPSLDFKPKTKVASLLVTKGEESGEQGNIEAALAAFQKALKLDPSLDFKPKTKVASLLVTRGEKLLQEKQFKDASAAYTEAQKLDPKVEISADSWNTLCWDGSLRGYAKQVMFACEKAVALTPDDGNYRNSRGLARALTGNTKGAIEDFQAFIASTKDKEDKSQRQRWVNALRAGSNPFTPEELKRLLNQ